MQVFMNKNSNKKCRDFLKYIVSGVVALGAVGVSTFTCSAYTFETGYSVDIDADGLTVFPDNYWETYPQREENCKKIWEMLKKQGVGDEMCAAILANIACESSFEPCASEFIVDNDNGRGIFMYTPVPSNGLGVGCHHDLEVFVAGKTDHRHGAGTDCSVHHAAGEEGEFTWQHCIPCQVEFFFQDPNFGGKILTGLERSTVSVPEGVTTATDLCKYDFLSACGGDVDKALKLATEDFCFYCEAPDLYQSHIGGRVKNARKIYDKFKGTVASSEENTEGIGLDGSMPGGEFLSEDTFIPNKSLKETAIVLPEYFVDRADTVEAVNWRKAIEGSREVHKYDTLRGIIMFAGIVLCVYSILLYVAYTFDTINNLIDIDLLSVITLGHLRVADDEKSASSGGSNGATNLVAHSQILKYTCLGIGIGCLIVSGGMYKIILWVFDFVSTHILGR